MTVKRRRGSRFTLRKLAHAAPSTVDGLTPCCGLTMRELARSRPHDRYAYRGSDYPVVTCDGSWLRGAR